MIRMREFAIPVSVGSTDRAESEGDALVTVGRRVAASETNQSAGNTSGNKEFRGHAEPSILPSTGPLGTAARISDTGECHARLGLTRACRPSCI